MDKRISKKELSEMYGVDKNTIENWVKNLGLPLLSITSHSKFIRKTDLEKWENNFSKNLK